MKTTYKAFLFHYHRRAEQIREGGPRSPPTLRRRTEQTLDHLQLKLDIIFGIGRRTAVDPDWPDRISREKKCKRRTVRRELAEKARKIRLRMKRIVVENLVV